MSSLSEALAEASKGTLVASSLNSTGEESGGRSKSLRSAPEVAEGEEGDEDNDVEENAGQASHLEPKEAPGELRLDAEEAERRLFAGGAKIEGLKQNLKSKQLKLFKSKQKSRLAGLARRRKRLRLGQTERQALTSTVGYGALAGYQELAPPVAQAKTALSATIKQHFPSLANSLNLTAAVQRLLASKLNSALSGGQAGQLKQATSVGSAQAGFVGAPALPLEQQPAEYQAAASSNFAAAAAAAVAEDILNSSWAESLHQGGRDHLQASSGAPVSVLPASEAAKPGIPVEIIGLDPAVTDSILLSGPAELFSAAGSGPSPRPLSHSASYGNLLLRQPQGELGGSGPGGPPRASSVLHVHHFHLDKRPAASSQLERPPEGSRAEPSSPSEPQLSQQQVFLNDKGQLVHLAVESQAADEQDPAGQPEQAAEQSSPEEPGSHSDMVMVSYKPAANQTHEQRPPAGSYNDAQESLVSSKSLLKSSGGSKQAERASRPEVPLNSRPMSSAMLRLQMHSRAPPDEWPAGAESPLLQPANGYASLPTRNLLAGFKNATALLQQQQPASQQSLIESLELLRRLQQGRNPQQQQQQPGHLLFARPKPPNSQQELHAQLLPHLSHLSPFRQHQPARFEMTQASDQLPSSNFPRSQSQRFSSTGRPANLREEGLLELAKFPAPVKPPFSSTKLRADSTSGEETLAGGGGLSLAVLLVGFILALAISAVLLLYRHRRRRRTIPNMPGRSRLNLTQRTKEFMRSNFVKPSEVTAIKSLSLSSSSGTSGPAGGGQGECPAQGARYNAAGNPLGKTFLAGAHLSSFTTNLKEAGQADIRTLNTKLQQPKPSYFKSLISSSGSPANLEAEEQSSKRQPLEQALQPNAGYQNFASNKQKLKPESSRRPPKEQSQLAGNYSSFVGAAFRKTGEPSGTGAGPQQRCPEAKQQQPTARIHLAEGADGALEQISARSVAANRKESGIARKSPPSASQVVRLIQAQAHPNRLKSAPTDFLQTDRL